MNAATDGQREWGRGQERMKPRERTARKLTPAQIDEIRQRLRDGANAKDLALEYGVTASTIREYRP